MPKRKHITSGSGEAAHGGPASKDPDRTGRRRNGSSRNQISIGIEKMTWTNPHKKQPELYLNRGEDIGRLTSDGQAIYAWLVSRTKSVLRFWMLTCVTTSFLYVNPFHTTPPTTYWDKQASDNRLATENKECSLLCGFRKGSTVFYIFPKTTSFICARW